METVQIPAWVMQAVDGKQEIYLEWPMVFTHPRSKLRIVLCTRPLTSQHMTAHDVIAWEGKLWNVNLITRDIYIHDS